MVAHRDPGPEGRAPRRAPSDPAEREVQTARRRSRALEEPLDVRPRGDAPFPELEVRNPVRQTRYRVLLPAWPSRESAMCVCADFARRGLGTCKHLEAAWIWLDTHPGALPTRPVDDQRTTWAAIGARRIAEPGLARGRALRKVGAALFEWSSGRVGSP